MTLEKALGQLFGPGKLAPTEFKLKRKRQDPVYRMFRALCKKHGITYKIAPDCYIDLVAPDGSKFAYGHYGDWSETLTRLEQVIETGREGLETWSYFVKEGETK
jgi:hypothetical protein